LIDLNNLNQFFSENKIKDYVFILDEVIGIQSTKYYANAQENLGYYTLAQYEENYRKKISELIEEFSVLNQSSNKLTILELGGGTGKFCQFLTRYLLERDIKYEYTLVDVSIKQYSETVRKIPGLQLVNDSFTNFSKKNKRRFDFLIMNEALDMWAGEEELLNLWEPEPFQEKVYWLLIDLDKHEPIKKKIIEKISKEDYSHLCWTQIYYNEEKNTFTNMLEEPFRNKIHLPTSFSELLGRIDLIAIIQDYWSFDDQENKLRMELYKKSVDETLNLISGLSEAQIKLIKSAWEEKVQHVGEKYSWIESQIIPFGFVDVTYSPDQSELFDLGIKWDLEIVNYYAENMNNFDDSFFSVGDKNNEIFLLFTKKALELQFNRF
jgi:hypothetical protein